MSWFSWFTSDSNEYADFKVRAHKTIDEILQKYNKFPTEVIEIAQNIKKIGYIEDTNVIGEVTAIYYTHLIKRFHKYNESIDDLVKWRKFIDERTYFGWFILTKANLLTIISNIIQRIESTHRLVTSDLGLEKSTIRLWNNGSKPNIINYDAETVKLVEFITANWEMTTKPKPQITEE